MQYHPTIKNDTSHLLVEVTGHRVTVQRIKAPRLKLSYNFETKEHKIIDQGEVADDKINSQVKKTIAWINHNIRLEK